MTENKHTVTTDALATLGYIIDETAQRDAIHLAVEPVVAGELLHAGQHVGKLLREGETQYGITTNTVGIVDPFLRGPVHRGQRFWLVLYPRQITSLRHVWEHPEFPPSNARQIIDAAISEFTGNSAQTIITDEITEIGIDPGAGDESTHVIASPSEKEKSEKWLRDYAEKIDETFNQLMRAAKNWLEGREYFMGAEEHGMFGKFEGESTNPQFWHHYQIYTGEFVPEDKQENFFTCSC